MYIQLTDARGSTTFTLPACVGHLCITVIGLEASLADDERFLDLGAKSFFEQFVQALK